MHHHLFQFWIIIIALTVCALFSCIPLEKYQFAYKKFIYDFNSAPQRHLNSQIEYANRSGAVDIPVFRYNAMGTKSYENSNIRKPYYVRDKYNPNILYRYHD